jgi:hypothetical protein
VIDHGRYPRRHIRTRQPEVGEAHQLTLAHRDAADGLGEIFSEADTDFEFLDLTVFALGLHALGIGQELAQALDIGGEPGQPMGRSLFAIEHAAHGVAAIDRDALAHRNCGVLQKRFDDPERLPGLRDECVGYFGPLRCG